MMESRTRPNAGVWLILSPLSAVAQSGPPAKAVTLMDCASCSPASQQVIIPSDPNWFVAGLVTGLILGVVGARVFGGAKRN